MNGVQWPLEEGHVKEVNRMIVICLVLNGLMACLLGIVGSDFGVVWTERRVQAIGQLFSSIDIALGFYLYLQAGKRRPIRSLLCFPSLFALPFYLVGGDLKTAFLYVFIALVIQALVIYRWYRRIHETV